MPDFEQLLKVIRREEPDRPVLFEIGLNGRLIERYADSDLEPDWRGTADNAYRLSAWRNLGYDYCRVVGSRFGFPSGERDKARSVSMNQGAVIADRADFEAYEWPDPDDADYSSLQDPSLPEGMKLVVWGPGGVLENVVSLVGFERLCYLVADDPALTEDIFSAVGSRLVRYYEICAAYDSAGALMANDDWGFKTQTMLAPHDMRRYVIPWHRSIVQVIHDAGKPALLHCCGNLEAVMEDIVEDIGYDAKHSFEDSICPVEEAYERWRGRIAVLGGIDVDFLCRAEPDEIRARSRAMLERADGRGGYALGSGNSIPDYVPDENYLAMTEVALED
ncbi:MAG: uroporphyrinogen decarboxylase family protein [Candidatus Brocadiia bacterium]